MKIKDEGKQITDLLICVFVRISKDGYCSASCFQISKLIMVRYDGYLVPLKDQPNNPPQEVNPI